MNTIRKLTAALLAAVFAFRMSVPCRADENVRRINIDGNSASFEDNSLWEGLGAVTSGGSSALLAAYKRDCPAAYNEMIKLLFGRENGAGLDRVTVEMGCGANSSAGTEPSLMDSPDEIPDLTRSFGWQFAADARETDPGVSVELIRFGEPRWVTEAFADSCGSGYAARYRWYKAHIDAAYDTYGLKIDCISADVSETDHPDTEWAVYLATRLRAETSGRYDYGSIGISLPLGAGEPSAAGMMLADARLLGAADVIDIAESDVTDNDARTLAAEYGIKLRCSEGSVPVNVPPLSGEEGWSGKNGPLDTAGDIINSVCRGGMTAYSFRPAAAAYYSGTKYFPAALITANTPWNGSFTCGDGIITAAHFTRFTEKGFAPVRSACIGSTESGTQNCLTLIDSDKRNYTVIMTDRSTEDSACSFTVLNTADPSLPLHVWESSSEGTRRLGDITPHRDGMKYCFDFTVRAGTIVTLTTLDGDMPSVPAPAENPVLPLPYHDGFDSDRGYICTQGGTFTVTEGRLVQTVTEDTKPVDWLYKTTPLPSASLGDDRWSDYCASAEIQLCDADSENFAGIGIRYCSAVTDEDTAVSGYRLLIYGDGRWEVSKAYEVLGSGSIPGFDAEEPHILTIGALGDRITAGIDGETVSEISESGSFADSGRISLWSAYARNSFDDLHAEALGSSPYITRSDALCGGFVYSGSFTCSAVSSYTFHNRTSVTLDTGTVFIPADSEAFCFDKNWKTGRTAKAQSDNAAALLSFSGDSLVISGSGLSDAVLYLDNTRTDPLSAEDGKIKLTATDAGHTLRIVCSRDAVIKHAVCGRNPEDASFSFKYTGGGFALAGENGVSAALDITVDGNTERIFTAPTLTREAFYSIELPYAEHEVTVDVIRGRLCFDTAEIKDLSAIETVLNAPDEDISRETSDGVIIVSGGKSASGRSSEAVYAGVTVADAGDAAPEENGKLPAPAVIAAAVIVLTAGMILIFRRKN